MDKLSRFESTSSTLRGDLMEANFGRGAGIGSYRQAGEASTKVGDYIHAAEASERIAHAFLTKGGTGGGHKRLSML